MFILPYSPHDVFLAFFQLMVQTRRIQIGKSVSLEAVKYFVTASLDLTEYFKFKCSFDELI